MKILDNYIELLRPIVEEIFEEESSGHDISHLERTMKNALFIQRYEGGDELVIGVATFLHDIHRIMQNEKGRYCTPKESLSKIEEILNSVDFPKDKLSLVMHAIEYHEVYNWDKNVKQVEDIETLILQDADNLDAIGAIGIARTFNYGGAHGVNMYNPNIPLITDDSYSEDSDIEASTIHHFYHKLFKLGDNMNTKTAKILASDKIDFMKNYVDVFIKEWNGDYK
ncbi:MAG: HD domain-containing protein [Bacilli bacterium]|nr:HD domain-containing protein [Bacilli bacterium]